LSLFFVAITGSDVGGLGITVTDLALRGFSRRQESKADEFGLAIVNAEYGHVNEASRLFLRWDTDSNFVGDIVSYLSTHPNPGDRVEEMRVLADRKAWRTDGEVTDLPW
ncbi:MAG: M48 family metalloprotease, partial [Proteobacteria bacterium]|nr:M48 family metalloprotease [Pseudomonadota bacterium]